MDLLYDGPPGSLLAKLSSRDDSGDYSFDSPLKDPEAEAPSGGIYPWRLDGGRRTAVHLKNTTDRAEQAFVQFRWAGGAYTPEPVTIGPWESVSLDVERIRLSGQPDLTGTFFPSNADAGQLVWYSRKLPRGQGTSPTPPPAAPFQ